MVWQRAMDFVEAIYRETRCFPKEELYALTSQMRRAAVSIPSNDRGAAVVTSGYISSMLRMARCEKSKLKFSSPNASTTGMKQPQET